MIVVNAVIESSEVDIQMLKTAIAEMEVASRQEAGCFDYTFSVELNQPGTLRVTECWDSMEALSRHFTEPHMAAFQAALAAHPPKSVRATFYEANEVVPPGR
ncbi:MAG: putative quinol monooxygenase [Pseudomonadales bacterium]